MLLIYKGQALTGMHSVPADGPPGGIGWPSAHLQMVETGLFIHELHVLSTISMYWQSQLEGDQTPALQGTCSTLEAAWGSLGTCTLDRLPNANKPTTARPKCADRILLLLKKPQSGLGSCPESSPGHPRRWRACLISFFPCCWQTGCSPHCAIKPTNFRPKPNLKGQGTKLASSSQLVTVACGL